MSDMVKLILTLAVLTYATRFGGHVILSRFKRINPRVEAALDAVPAAVITALVVPAAFTTGIPEFIGAAMAVLLSFRFSMLNALVLSTATVAVLRYIL